MNNQKQTFASLLLACRNEHSLHEFFDDFLSLCLCVLSPGVLAGLAWNRTLFDHLIRKNSGPTCPFNFLEILTAFLQEMSVPHPHSSFSDVLGDFYQEYLLDYVPDNPYLSWDFKDYSLSKEQLNARCSNKETSDQEVALLNNLCGSGRHLLSQRRQAGGEAFYGIEVCPVCAKMAILNLYLNGVATAEVVVVKLDCYTSAFRYAYAFSDQTNGIITVSKQEESAAWQLMEKQGINAFLIQHQIQ